MQKGKKTIVYTINQEHNNHLCQEFNETGHKCVAIDSKTKKEERDKYVAQFRKGEIDIICNVNIFSEGFDCPDVECIQLARPTKSLSMYLQQVGRGLRISKNKEKTIFLDNIGLYNIFRLPSANRYWQYYFEGQEDSDNNERGYVSTLEDDYSPRIYNIKEADDEMDLQYSNVEDKDSLSIVNVAKELNIEIDKIITFFSNKGVELSPNSILTEEQYLELKDMLEKQQKSLEDGFINIFDIPNSEATGIKRFYCKVKNYKENKWEIIYYNKFTDCYVDIVDRVYVDCLKNTTREDRVLEIFNSISSQPIYKQWKTLSNTQFLNTTLENNRKLIRLKYLLNMAKEVVYFNFDENFDNTKEIEAEEVNEEVIENKNIIKDKDMEYNIEEMDEKGIINLMLLLHDKLSVNIIDEKAAEQRLEEIEKEEKESKDKELIEKYENLPDDELERLLELRKKKRQEEKNKELEAIARKNIEIKEEREKERQKEALNYLIEKYNSK